MHVFKLVIVCVWSQVRGHMLADIDPLEINRARVLGSELLDREMVLSTYKYHMYHLGKLGAWLPPFRFVVGG